VSWPPEGRNVASAVATALDIPRKRFVIAAEAATVRKTSSGTVRASSPSLITPQRSAVLNMRFA